MPLLLITFIENSFKYGELHDAKHSLSIKLSVVDDTLFFKTHNWKRRGPKEESEGIGIELRVAGRIWLQGVVAV